MDFDSNDILLTTSLGDGITYIGKNDLCSSGSSLGRHRRDLNHNNYDINVQRTRNRTSELSLDGILGLSSKLCQPPRILVD